MFLLLWFVNIVLGVVVVELLCDGWKKGWTGDDVVLNSR
jgi:hypothetical protein